MFVLPRRIDKARALEDFRHLVASEVLKDIDGRESGRRYHLVSWKIWRTCLTNLGRRCTQATPLSSLSDEEVRVLRQLCGRFVLLCHSLISNRAHIHKQYYSHQ